MLRNRLHLSLFAVRFLVFAAFLTVVPWNGSARAQGACDVVFGATSSLAARLETAEILTFEKADLDGKTEHYIVTFVGGLKAIFKPAPEFWGPGASKDVWARRANPEAEAIVHRIDALMALGFVPTTVLRTIRGMRGSLQLWVTPDGSAIAPRELAKLSAFDYLLNNLDRSGADFKAGEGSRNLLSHRHRPVAIDNALSLQPLHEFQTYASRDPIDELDLYSLRGNFAEGLRAITTSRLREIMPHPRYDSVIREIMVRRNKLRTRIAELR